MPTGRLAGLCVAFAACVSPLAERAEPRIAVGGDSPIVGMIDRISAETGVPAALLATIAHVGTRFRITTDHHTHGAGAAGIFGLTPATVAHGARLAGVSELAARTEIEAGLRAGAALLREAAPHARTLDEYLEALEPNLRRSVLRSLARGVDARDVDGKSIVITARSHDHGPFSTVEQQAEEAPPGYPGATWFPAYSGNYDEANRGIGDITNIVVHTTQGGFNGVISWFQDPDANVSAHYLVRSEDGFVAQMVSEKNIAWHDRCFNTNTIGIEHEGFVEDPELWYTEPLYIESAKLASFLADKYGIEKTRGPIVGHDTAPDCSTHTDPGEGWDWDHYLELVQTGGAPIFAAEGVIVQGPPTLIAGERATYTVTITNTGNTAWEPDLTRLGTAQPHDRESELFADGDWLSPSRIGGIDARVDRGGTGTFTFDVVAPSVREPTVFAETFQLIEEDVTWFGPDIHLVVQVMPTGEEPGGCSSSRGSGLAGLFLVGAIALVIRSRRRR
jgi:hypothetical protein